MSRRAVVKRSAMGGYLAACRRGKRHVTARKRNQYVPANGVKTDCRKSGRRLVDEAARRLDRRIERPAAT